jgi:putative DNA primase/helicase
MNTEEILNKLEAVSETSNGWQARCPAHDDAKASLSIAEDGGKTLMRCHAGCETTDVVEAMGLKMRDLFPDEAEERKVVARYNYDDQDGELLLQIVRDNHKNFRARRPDGNGGWVYSTAGVKLVPYQLPMILRKKRVLITEGEKDSDTGCRDLRLPSTTAPFGAGKWREEFSAYFKGKSVALCPHNDDAGRKHMQSVACSLFPVAKEIKIVSLPFGKDLSEWVALGGNREQFVSLVKAAPVVTAEQVESWQQIDVSSLDELEDKSIGELMAEPEQTVTWLCDGMLPSAGSSLLSAKAKVGKTTMARCLAAAVVRGEKFLGRRTKRGAVLYFCGIEEKVATVRHFRKLGVTAADPIRIISASMTPKNFYAQLEKYIRRYQPKLIVLDPYMRFLGIDDVNDYAKNMKTFAPIISLATKNKVHIVFAGHFGKADRAEVSDQVLGSTAIFGMVDTGLFLRERPHFRTVQTKQRHTNQHGNLPETELRYDPARDYVWLGVTKEEADVGRVTANILRFLEQSHEPKTEQKINDAVEGSTKLLRDTLRQMVTDKKVKRQIVPKENGGRGRNPYVYSIASRTTE